jgi:16S rRNA processing protein RimM
MLLVVGQIGKPHGIRGEVSVYVRTDEPEERFTAGSVFTTEVPRNQRGVNVDPAVYVVPEKLVAESVRFHQGRAIVAFEGVPDRNVAEALRGVLLQVDSAGLPDPEDPEEFNDHQLVGLRVEDADGTVLGTVARIDHAPASDLVVLDKPGGGTALIPFVTAMVPTVDLAGGRLVVTLPEGLLDL